MQIIHTSTIPNKRKIEARYTPKLLQSLVRKYEYDYETDVRSLEDIWEEICDTYRDEALADRVAEELEFGEYGDYDHSGLVYAEDELEPEDSELYCC